MQWHLYNLKVFSALHSINSMQNFFNIDYFLTTDNCTYNWEYDFKYNAAFELEFLDEVEVLYLKSLKSNNFLIFCCSHQAITCKLSWCDVRGYFLFQVKIRFYVPGLRLYGRCMHTAYSFSHSVLWGSLLAEAGADPDSDGNVSGCSVRSSQISVVAVSGARQTLSGSSQRCWSCASITSPSEALLSLSSVVGSPSPSTSDLLNTSCELKASWLTSTPIITEDKRLCCCWKCICLCVSFVKSLKQLDFLFELLPCRSFFFQNRQHFLFRIRSLKNLNKN